MIDKNTKITIIILIIMIFVALPIFGIIFSSEKADGISLACQKSPECQAALKKEREAAAKAVSSARSANAYQIKVDELSVEIAEKESEIAVTTAEINSLQAEIEVNKKRLNEEQEALVELLVSMHFESDAEPIRILAGATSISDLAEKAARDEVVKEQISVSANAVKQTKEKLEADKAEIEKLLSQQQEAKKELVAKRTEQQDLVDKFANDAEAYEAQVLAAREAQRVAEKAYRDAHPGMFASTSYDGIDTYRSYFYDFGLESTGGAFGYECPRDWDRYTTRINGRKIGGKSCECVSYVGWKAYERYGIYLAYGDARDWKAGAEAAGYKTGTTPEVGSIGWWSYGRYGHVFWVESVNADGSIDVTDYNYNIDGRFTARHISAGTLNDNVNKNGWRFIYLHS